DLDPDTVVSLDPVVLPPGEIAEAITVGALDATGISPAWYSGRLNSLQYYAMNTRPIDYSPDEVLKPDVLAPGSLLLGSGRQFHGTSAATPLAAGTAILALSAGQSDIPASISTTDNCAAGSMGREIPTVSLAPSQTSNSCGNYEWEDDISSQYVADFLSPTLALAERDASESAGAAASADIERLVTLSAQQLNDGNPHSAVSLALQCLDMPQLTPNKMPAECLEALLLSLDSPTQEVFRMTGLEYPYPALSDPALSEDGTHLVWLDESAVHITRVSDGIEQYRLVFDEPRHAQWFQDQNTVVAFSSYRVARWDLTTQDTFLWETSESISDVKFNSDGTHAAIIYSVGGGMLSTCRTRCCFP
ncbi:MAG: S8/S53 family peptidase, partial [Anaerolineae bacterium]|nr:S8/S53 family peptidase [Anaerolineae bacterium]